MAAAAPPAPPPAGGANDIPLPAESILRRQIEEVRGMSVVRLRIKKATGYYGLCTGFIALNRTNTLVVMTCGHSFKEWAKDKDTEVTFHDHTEAKARVLFLSVAKEVALLAVDTSKYPELLNNPDKYPAVDFLYDDISKGEFLVMLGYPYSTREGNPDLGNFAGYVTNESAPIPTGAGHTVMLISGDYPSAAGASGSPVFGRNGMVVGIAIAGRLGVAYTLSVRWIQDTLMNGMDEAYRANLVNENIGDMIVAWLAIRLAAGAGSSSGAGGSGAQASAADQGSSQA